MGFWPFGRKKQRSDSDEDKARSMAQSKPKLQKAQRSEPAPYHRAATTAPSTAPSSRNDTKRSRSTAAKGQSFKARGDENIQALPPIPSFPPLSKPGTPSSGIVKQGITGSPAASRQPLAEVQNRDDANYKNIRTLSNSSIQAEKFTVIPNLPTLKAKRTQAEGNLSAQKSSRRRAEEAAREQYVRSMSIPIPAPQRPRSLSGGLLARESRRIPGGLNRNFERPASEVSLPLAESLHSSPSDTAEMRGFKLGVFDALSPRPTIKYTENPRGGAYDNGPSRSSTRKDKGPIIPEEDFNTRERIDDLADDLNATALRELLERDRRRMERKRKTEHERLQRKLQRKSDKQRLQDQSAIPEQSPDSRAGLDAVGLGLDELPIQGHEEGLKHAPNNNDVAASVASWLDDPSKEHLPLEDPFVDPNDSRLDLATPDDKDEPVIQTAKAVRLSQATMTPPASPFVAKHARGPSNLSAMAALAPEVAPEQTREVIPEPVPARPEGAEQLAPVITSTESDASSRQTNSWTSFFRRSGTRQKRGSADRGRTTPSDFSNTSRESFARQKPPPPPVVERSFRRSGTPGRTQSKFREDLPELPATPQQPLPSSANPPRASPYVDRSSMISTLGPTGPAANASLEDIHPAFREEVAMSRNQSLRSPTPGDEAPSSALLSQSLASVDSEGSWLSGRPPKRLSGPMINPFSASNVSVSQNRLENETVISEESAFARQPPAASGASRPGGLTTQLNPKSTAAALSAIVADEDDHESTRSGPGSAGTPVKVSTVPGRRPLMVQAGTSAVSREGLLDNFNTSGAGDDSSESSPVADSPSDKSAKKKTGVDAGNIGTSIHRATSVEYGKSGHVRRISAGSARLLDLPPRQSADSKRASIISMERSPLSDIRNMTDAEREIRSSDAASSSTQP